MTARKKLRYGFVPEIAELLVILEPFYSFAAAILHDEDRKDDAVIVGKVIRDPAGDWGGRITFGDCRRIKELVERVEQLRRQEVERLR